jgi:hypothetical protein
MYNGLDACCILWLRVYRTKQQPSTTNTFTYDQSAPAGNVSCDQEADSCALERLQQHQECVVSNLFGLKMQVLVQVITAGPGAPITFALSDLVSLNNIAGGPGAQPVNPR